MTFYGLSVYDKCAKLLEVMKKKGLTEISEKELAIMIARYIGSSKFYNTIRNYITYLINFGMITKDCNVYRINYNVIEETAE